MRSRLDKQQCAGQELAQNGKEDSIGRKEKHIVVFGYYVPGNAAVCPRFLLLLLVFFPLVLGGLNAGPCTLGKYSTFELCPQSSKLLSLIQLATCGAYIPLISEGETEAPRGKGLA